ncbi:glycosyltransferase family 39 protein [Candidatus Daviesbacteria bacterium]|nr:glycosyltransferase family 39 protein [Candidatus Daviesbacteria bacterium]
MLGFKLSKKDLFWILSLAAIFILGFFLRIYRLEDLLGFYYDSGRDGLVIYDLLVNHKFTLIGPTSGIEGIFLGPFYYYLIAIGYLLGGGDPAVASGSVGFVNALAIILIFLIGKKAFNIAVGFIAAFLFALSFDAITFARWFANPAPIAFFSSLTLLSLTLLKLKKPGWWLAIGTFSIGLALQLEAASAIWFIPSTIAILLLLKIKIEKKWIILSVLAFGLTLLPQILFDLKHKFLLFKAFYLFLVTEKSFHSSFWDTVKQRLPFYLENYANALSFEKQKMLIFIVLALASILAFTKRLFGKTDSLWGVWLLVLWIAGALIGLLFYQGNNGYVWGYYLSGTMPAFFLLIGFLIYLWLQKLYLWPLALIFLYIFLNVNLAKTQSYLSQGEPAENTINFTNQKQAIDYIYQDAKTKDFNVDVYVPPVIPYSYDYLILWYGQKNYGFVPKKENTLVLYTLEEVDSPHPERLKAFLDRQNSFSEVITTKKIGGITIEKRLRTKPIISQ